MCWRTTLALALAVGIMTPPAAQGQDTRPGIGVWVFENGGSYGQEAEDFEALRVGLQLILMTELARTPAIRVVERSRLNALIVDCETTEIVKATGLQEPREQLYQLIVDLTSRLTSDVSLPALVIEEELEEQA